MIGKAIMHTHRHIGFTCDHEFHPSFDHAQRLIHRAVDMVIHGSGSEAYEVVFKGSASLHSQDPGDDTEWTDVENLSDLGADGLMCKQHLMVIIRTLKRATPARIMALFYVE